METIWHGRSNTIEKAWKNKQGLYLFGQEINLFL